MRQASGSAAVAAATPAFAHESGGIAHVHPHGTETLLALLVLVAFRRRRSAGPGAEAPESATALVGEMQILIPMAGLIDKEAEQLRLEKEIGKIQKDMERIQAKLTNPNFVEKAPETVVEKEREKLADQRSALAKLGEQLERIRSL